MFLVYSLIVHWEKTTNRTSKLTSNISISINEKKSSSSLVDLANISKNLPDSKIPQRNLSTIMFESNLLETLRVEIIDLNSEDCIKNVEQMFEFLNKEVIKKIEHNEKIAKIDIKFRDFTKKKRQEDLAK